MPAFGGTSEVYIKNSDGSNICYLKGSEGSENTVYGPLKSNSIQIDSGNTSAVGYEVYVYVGSSEDDKEQIFFGDNQTVTVEIPEKYLTANPIYFTNNNGDICEVVNDSLTGGDYYDI